MLSTVRCEKASAYCRNIMYEKMTILQSFFYASTFTFKKKLL